MIEVRDNEDLSRALARFRREVRRSGIFREIRRRREYEKPSVARNRKRQQRKHEKARRRARRDPKRQQPRGRKRGSRR